MFENLLNKNKDIDFLKAYYLSNKKSEFDFKKILYFIAVELAVFIIISSVLLYKATYYKIQNENLSRKIGELQKIEKQLNEFQAIKTLYEKKLSINNKVTEDNDYINNAIVELEQITPSEVIYENINISKGKIMFIIKSSKEENIAQFLNNLQNSDKFSNISFNGISNQNNIKRTSISADIVRK
ncbi:Fimbrial assembly protein (PilN) [Caloramator mitchellensis]|uniref:Fimbrial assembly protein (PilN) n=1 Tax=Caloramator mitchellensis TaxID=908809 RepID=A0A0R3JX22_CALMK|nr:PilN domain-containing protein [Caloramator mitchellensis]KRQ88083.1 Fimbrial assembly protein (PilN) [Caloramator mitchellensis]